MSVWVSDQTCAQLDPAAARLPGRARLALAAAIAGFALVLVTVVVAAASGVVSPRLVGMRDTVFESPGGRGFTEVVAVHTEGWFDEDVVGVDARLPNAAATVLSWPHTIPRHRDAHITVRVVLTDCDSMSSDLTLAVHVRRPWGTLTHTIALGSLDEQGSMFDSLANAVCGN